MLSGNETYTIAVYAENSAGIGRAAEIQWPFSGSYIFTKYYHAVS